MGYRESKELDMSEGLTLLETGYPSPLMVASNTASGQEGALLAQPPITP